MKICKKILAATMIVAMLSCAVSTLAEVAPEYPVVPEGYDGYVTVTVEALTLGWGYIAEPTLVPYVEGETIAIVTDRLLDSLGINYNGGDIGSSFYISGVACPEILNNVEPNVPDYLMEQLELYPAWAEENFGYSLGGWNGVENGNGMLGEFDYSDLAGWMIADNDVLISAGAGVWPVEQGHSYRWMFSIYGYGMDTGSGDSWGMFPDFDNPATGVSRVEADTHYACIMADPSLSVQVTEGSPAYAEFTAFKTAMENLASCQADIDSTLANLLEALSNDEVLAGDINGDGIITTYDAVIIMRHAMEVSLLEGSMLAAADYNGDGVIDIADAVNVLRIVISLK